MTTSIKTSQKRKKIAPNRESSKPIRATGHIGKNGPFLPPFTNHCFGCAPANRTGLRLQFTEHRDNGTVESIFRIAKRFEGPPGYVHGGVIATILDEAMGKVNRCKGVIALTRHMSVDYLQPIPLNTKLRAVGWEVRHDGRKHFHLGEIRALDGTVLARGEGLFVAIDAAKMFQHSNLERKDSSAR